MHGDNLQAREISESEEISYYLACYRQATRQDDKVTLTQVAIAFWVAVLGWYLIVGWAI